MVEKKCYGKDNDGKFRYETKEKQEFNCFWFDCILFNEFAINLIKLEVEKKTFNDKTIWDLISIRKQISSETETEL